MYLTDRAYLIVDVIHYRDLAHKYSFKQCGQLLLTLVSGVQTKKMATQYVGKMFDGQMHGLGKLIYDNEEYYNGEFVRGKRSTTN